MPKEWSKYQQKVFEHIATQPGRNLVVEAKPGSGKTTTSVECVSRVPKGKKVLMCAFNAKIRDELQERVGKAATVRTFNQLGFHAVIKARGPLTVNGARQRDLVRSVLPDKRIIGNDAYGDVLKIVDLAMARLAVTDDDFHHIMEAFDCYPAQEGRDVQYIAWAREVLRLSLEMSPEISFNDQIYIPTMQNLTCSKFDYVFVDEAQDCNPAQIQLIRQVLKPQGKLVAVGDRRQAIYGWRGADPHVMEDIVTAFNADILPLSITYRCPRSVVGLVNHIVSDLEAAPSASEGAVTLATEKQFLEGVSAGDFVISRTNAAIVKYSMQLLLRNRRCAVLGKDLSAGLSKLLDVTATTEVAPMLAKLEAYVKEEGDRLMAARREDKAEELLDRAEALRSLSEGCTTTNQIRVRLERLFGNDNSTAPGVITFSTVHKAKGLEFKRVWMFETTFNVNSREGENLYYVAATRTIDSLFLVQIPRRDSKPPRSIAERWKLEGA